MPSCVDCKRDIPYGVRCFDCWKGRGYGDTSERISAETFRSAERARRATRLNF